MNKLYTDIDKIDLFMKGELGEKEESEMRTQLMEDENFRDLFGDLELMIEGIKRSAEKSTMEEKLKRLKKAFDAEEEEDDDEDSEDNRLRITWYNRPVFRYVAASVVIIIAAWFVVRPFGASTGPELYAEYFEAYGYSNGATRGETIVDLRQDAYAAYVRKEFQQAVILLEEVVQSGTDADVRMADQFYLGNAYLEMRDADKAINVLSIVVAEGKGRVAVQAKWYLALAYLLKDDVETAKELIRQFHEEEGANYDKAADILNELD